MLHLKIYDIKSIEIIATEELVPVLQPATRRCWGCFGLMLSLSFLMMNRSCEVCVSNTSSALLLLWILHETVPDITKLPVTPWTRTAAPFLNTFNMPGFALCVSQTIHKSHKAQVGQYSLMQTTELFSFPAGFIIITAAVTASAEQSLMHLHRTSFNISVEQFLRELIHII